MCCLCSVTLWQLKMEKIYCTRGQLDSFGSLTLSVRWLVSANKTDSFEGFSPKGYFLCHICSLFEAPIKIAQHKNIVQVIY